MANISNDNVAAIPDRASKTGPWGLTGYQWLVLFAAWLGWGFDVFDGLLFNYVAPNCVPTLMHLHGDPKVIGKITIFWTGIAASVLLIGWAAGGIIFGRVADRIGRSHTLMITIAMYGVGTAACALAPNMGILLLCRFIAALGIGGEWAAGSSLVAEVVPEKRRLEAGALLYTSACAGVFLAVEVNRLIAGTLMLNSPQTSWRYVLASGLIAAALAFAVLRMVKEPPRWKNLSGSSETAGRIRDLFLPENRRLTLSGFIPAVISLITWWSCSSFIQVLATSLARAYAAAHGYNKPHTMLLGQHWIEISTNWFTIGGLIGTLLTVPIAKSLGRRNMFRIYFALSAVAVMAAFGHAWTPYQQLLAYFPIGLTVFGVFGSFTFYLPELFPTRLRATGAGFCYNIGRLITAVGPFLVASIAQRGPDTLVSAKSALFTLGFVPLFGLLLTPLIIETKGRGLTD